jgi:hypothetical protein
MSMGKRRKSSNHGLPKDFEPIHLLQKHGVMLSFNIQRKTTLGGLADIYDKLAKMKGTDNMIKHVRTAFASDYESVPGSLPMQGNNAAPAGDNVDEPEGNVIRYNLSMPPEHLRIIRRRTNEFYTTNTIKLE